MEAYLDPRLVREVNLLLERFEAHCRRHAVAASASCPEPFLEREGCWYYLGYAKTSLHHGLMVRVVAPAEEVTDPLCDMRSHVRVAAIAHLEPLLRRIREEQETTSSPPEVETQRRRSEEELLDRIRAVRERIAASPPAT